MSPVGSLYGAGPPSPPRCSPASLPRRCWTQAPSITAIWLPVSPQRGPPSPARPGSRRGDGSRAARDGRACPPNAATVPLDDGVADGQPDAHAVTLRRVEGIQQLVALSESTPTPTSAWPPAPRRDRTARSAPAASGPAAAAPRDSNYTDTIGLLTPRQSSRDRTRSRAASCSSVGTATALPREPRLGRFTAPRARP